MTLLIATLKKHAALRGMLYDLPHVIERSRPNFAAAGVADRCQLAGGSFFESIPAGADAYLMRHIIHDWDDERSATILKNCRAAISAAGKLLLIERVMPAVIDASAGHQRWTMLDMHMLVMLGGRERTEEEFRSVLAAANFKLRRTLLLPGATGFSIIEATPI